MISYENSTLPRLFEIIEERKITAKELADATGIAKSSIAMWRSGARKPKIEAIQSIADYLNVPLEYLTGSEKKEENKLDLKIQVEVKQLSDEQKADVLKYIEFVKSKN